MQSNELIQNELELQSGLREIIENERALQAAMQEHIAEMRALRQWLESLSEPEGDGSE